VEWTYGGLGHSSYSNTASQLESALRTMGHVEGRLDGFPGLYGTLMSSPLKPASAPSPAASGIHNKSKAVPSMGAPPRRQLGFYKSAT
jgi:hypothetical protein